MIPHPSNKLSLCSHATPSALKSVNRWKYFHIESPFWLGFSDTGKEPDVLPSNHNLFFLFIRRRMWQKQTGSSASVFPPRSSFFLGAATLMTHSATVTVALRCKCFRRSEQQTDGSSHFRLSEAKSVDMEFNGLQKKSVFSANSSSSMTESPERRERLDLIFSKVRAPTASSDSQSRYHPGKKKP